MSYRILWHESPEGAVVLLAIVADGKVEIVAERHAATVDVAIRAFAEPREMTYAEAKAFMDRNMGLPEAARGEPTQNVTATEIALGGFQP